MVPIVEIDPTAHLITSVTPSIVYRAIVSAIHKSDKKYFGISETPFKDRYNNHTRDFRHKEYVNSTELSKYIWKLKDEGETPSITWNIMPVPRCFILKVSHTFFTCLRSYFVMPSLFNSL